MGRIRQWWASLWSRAKRQGAGSYRTAAVVKDAEPGPVMCKSCGLKPPDRYYPPDVGLCRDCFIDEVIATEGSARCIDQGCDGSS
jgi:hypothetical protein